MPDAFVDISVGDDEAKDVYTDERGIHVGIGLIWELKAAVLAFTQFLLKNYCWQMLPIMGQGPLLSKLVTLDAFPLEALKLYAANLIPEAIAKDGYEKRPIQSIIESIETLRFTKASPVEVHMALSRRQAKAPLDLRIWLRDFNIDDSIDQYFDSEIGPYCLALNYQLMLDAVHFLLAHEMAHYLLDHMHPAQNFAQLRAEEVEADKLALEILQFVPGFQLRSLLSLFGFFQMLEESTLNATTPSSELLTHPFSRDRMLILCDTVLRDQRGEALRADVNTGMSMLSTPLEPIRIRYRWEDGFEEEFTVYAYYYSDMDFNAYLQLYLERTPRSIESHLGVAWQNAFLLSRLNFEIQLVLRDRINPGTTFCQGRVLFRPGMSKKGDLLNHDPELPICLLHTRLVAPPEWWLTHTNTVLAIESIKKIEQLLPEPDDKFSPVLQYDMQLVKLDYVSYLQSLPSPEEDVTPCAIVLLAARRFHEEKRLDLAVLFYEWVYSSNKQKLLYPDLINMVFDLIELNKLPDAAQIAQYALSGDKVMRPGFHYALAVYFSNRGQFTESMEHAFLEWLGFGVFGEYTKQAKALYSSILNNLDDPLIDLLRKFHFCYGSAEKYEKQEQTSKALQFYRQASMYLDIASLLAQDSIVFLRQYAAETLCKICILEEHGLHQAKEAFETIRERAPQFVPALIWLANIALFENDLPRARALWKEANTKMPIHDFVLNFRDHIEKPNPKYKLNISQRRIFLTTLER